MIPSSSLNISCSCRACATFLRPTPASSEQPHLPPPPPPLLSLQTSPATSDSTNKEKKEKKNTLLPTPSWVDKLSLSAYDVATLTPEICKPLHASLSINTSGLQKASSAAEAGEENQSTHSAFPKTPGTLRCTRVDCRTRISFASGLIRVGGLNVKAPLCEEHGDDADVFYDAEVISDAVSEKKIPSVVMAETGLQSSESLIFRADGGVRGRGRASRKIAPESAKRTSSAASWSSVTSIDGSKLPRSGDVSFEWTVRAFDSRLCW